MKKKELKHLQGKWAVPWQSKFEEPTSGVNRDRSSPVYLAFTNIFISLKTYSIVLHEIFSFLFKFMLASFRKKNYASLELFDPNR